MIQFDEHIFQMGWAMLELSKPIELEIRVQPSTWTNQDIRQGHKGFRTAHNWAMKKTTGCWGYIRDCTTQLCGDYFINHEILPGKLTCPLKINCWKMYSLLKQSFFRGHVNLPGCIRPFCFIRGSNGIEEMHRRTGSPWSKVGSKIPPRIPVTTRIFTFFRIGNPYY